MASINTHKGKSWLLDIQPYIQFSVTILVIILLYYWEKGQSKGYIITLMFSIVGTYSSVQSFMLKKIFEDNLQPLQEISKIIDLNTDVSKFSELTNSYLRITDNVFNDIKEEIIEDAVERLKQISQLKSLMLTKSQFYEHIFQLLEFHSINYSKIWAVSLLHESEWTNDPYENKFLEKNFRVTEGNVILERIFVVSDDKILELLKDKEHPVTRHFMVCPHCVINDYDSPRNETSQNCCQTCDIKDKKNILPYVVSVDYINKYQPELLKNSFGFIAFDNKLIFVDSNELDNEERYSKISMATEEIKKANNLFLSLKRYQVEICKYLAPE